MLPELTIEFQRYDKPLCLKVSPRITLLYANGLCKWFPPQISLMLFDQSNHIHSICIST